MIIDDIKYCFISKYNTLEVEETLKYYKDYLTFSYEDLCSNIKIKKYNELLEKLNKLVKIISFDIFINSEPISDIDLVNDITGFISYLNQLYEDNDIDKESEFKLEIYLDKTLPKIVPIFTLKTVKNFNENIHKFIEQLDIKIKTDNTLVIYSELFNCNICNKNIKFTNSDIENPIFIDQSNVISIKNESTNSINFKSPNLLPEYFEIITECEELDNFFRSIKIALSSIYLFSTSEIKKDHYRLKIITHDILNVKSNFMNYNEVIFKLYLWAYSNLEKTELKIGLINSQIHLYISDNQLSTLNTGILSAVKSHYKLYEKENLDKYLYEKEKIENQIKDNIDENFKIVSNFGSTLGSNVIGTATYFVSVIILGALNGDVSKLFNKEISIVSYVILLCSFIFLISQNIYVKIKINYYLSIKNRIKSRYTDIFNGQDLENIFKHVEGDYESKICLRNSIITFSIIWILTLLALIVLTTIIGFYSNQKSTIFTLTFIFFTLYILIIINLEYWDIGKK